MNSNINNTDNIFSSADKDYGDLTTKIKVVN